MRRDTELESGGEHVVDRLDGDELDLLLHLLQHVDQVLAVAIKMICDRSKEHSPAYTAAETAASAHVSGRDFAKTVIVESGGNMAMVVLPANRKIVLSDFRDMLGDPNLKLAGEDDFIERFPDCDLGAMPPFGNRYGLPVYVARSLAGEAEIAFNAGTHREVFKLSYSDFADLVQPQVLDFATV